MADLKTPVGAHTIAEILSEPATWKSCLQAMEQSARLQSLAEKLPRNIEWVFIGCGSSFYLAQAASASWSILTGEKSRALPASEITLFPQLFPAGCQAVLITRSGYTSEVLQAAEYLESKLRSQTLAITCGANTPIAKIASHCIQLPAADEKSTVMTRSFTSMLITLQSLAAIRGNRRDVLKSLGELPGQVAGRLDAIHSAIKSLTESRAFADYVFLGQGPFFGIAQECMLKVKEMSCSYAQSFHTLEFRHGPKAIVSPETLITFLISESGFAAEVAVLEEIKKLGGTTLVVCNSGDSMMRRAADYLVELSLDVPEVARAAPSVIPGQLLGFYTGIKKGLNPDEPRNLSRVVMLESK
ncbi:MAG TPA: SIS domain-containing protein [Candidatus Acidoferrales bacterium]|nr:SIS domain-containing protein [Candidatus Acidoferrales bacterium]